MFCHNSDSVEDDVKILRERQDVLFHGDFPATPRQTVRLFHPVTAALLLEKWVHLLKSALEPRTDVLHALREPPRGAAWESESGVQA